MKNSSAKDSLVFWIYINNLNTLYNLVFNKNNLTTHALINLIESIRQTLDEGSCGIFLDLQKPFDTTDHKIFMHKLEFYEICGVYI